MMEDYPGPGGMDRLRMMCTYNTGMDGDALDGLSSGTRRMLDYAALLEGGARYAVLRHIARVSEEDMVEDIKEAVDAGILIVRPGEPNVYDFVDASLRERVIAEIGEARLPKLRARAQAASRRVAGP